MELLSLLQEVDHQTDSETTTDITVSSQAIAWVRLIGKLINNQYRLTSQLKPCDDDTSTIYQGEEVIRNKLIREIAVKVVISDKTESQVDEAIAATLLKHPNLLNCYTCGEFNSKGDEFIYLITEPVKSNLETSLQKGKLSELQTYRLIKHLASILNFLHNQPSPLIHQDLTPTNILKVKNTWKLSSFGNVKPEADIETSDNIESLGIIIYQALTGDLSSNLDSQLDLSNLPPHFSEIITGCLAGPENRWNIKRVLEWLAKSKGKSLAKLYLQKGRHSLKLKHYKRALKHFDKAINFLPTLPDAYLQKANTYFRLKDYSLAIENYYKTIELNPDSFEAYGNLGIANAEVKNYDDAIKYLTKSLEFSPNFALYYEALAITYQRLDNYDKAIEYISKAIKINPKSAKFLNFRGFLYTCFNNNLLAMKDFNEAIKIERNNYIYHLNLANVYYELYFYELAIAYYQNAIEIKLKNKGIDSEEELNNLELKFLKLLKKTKIIYNIEKMKADFYQKIVLKIR